MRLENRRIFRVLMETHFRWSIFNGKTGFRLLSSRNGQRRRRHGPKDSISFFGKKSSLFHQKSIFQRDFTVTPYRPTAALRTPNNPPYTRDEPGTNCGRWGWRFASLRFPRLPPTTAHVHLPYTCTYRALTIAGGSVRASSFSSYPPEETRTGCERSGIKPLRRHYQTPFSHPAL